MATRSGKKRRATEERLRLTFQTRRRAVDREAAARRARAERDEGPDRRDLTPWERDEEMTEVADVLRRGGYSLLGFEDR